MGRRRIAYRRVKIHRNYTVEELAQVVGAHKNTVRAWIKQGLAPTDDGRPALFRGDHIHAFFAARRATSKKPCRPGQIYCVKCREPKEPAGSMVDYKPLTGTSGNLVGICPTCESLIHRRVSRAKIDVVRGDLDVTFPEGEQHIRDRASSSLNCDSNKDD